jgi:RHS repeat-associated protein
MSLGTDSNGKSAGLLYLHESEPCADLATPVRLRYTLEDETALQYSDGALTGLNLDQGSVVIDSSDRSDYHYVLNFYDHQNTKFKSVKVENPNASATDYHQLKITETVYTSSGDDTKVILFTWDSATGTWTMGTGTGSDARYETLTSVWSSDNTQYTRTRVVTDASGTIVDREVIVYQKYSWGLSPISSEVGTGTNVKTATWSYYDEEYVDGYSYGLLKQANWAEGWTDTYTYTFDASGQMTGKTVTGTFKTTTTTYTYQELNSDSTNDLVVCTVEMINDQEVSRTYGVYLSAQDNKRVTYEIQCATLGAVSDITSIWSGSAGYQVTKTTTISNEDSVYDGKVSEVVSPNGTVKRYTYVTDADNSQRVETEVDGYYNSSGFVAVTQAVTTTDLFGNLILREVTDSNSSAVLSSETVNSWDHLGRPETVSYLDTTTSTTTYNCCGIESYIDRSGVATTYTYDEFKRVKSKTQAGITTGYTYDAYGRTLTETRSEAISSTSNFAYTVRTMAYNANGEMISSTDALNQTTTYSRVLNASTGYWVRTTTYPDGTTRIETSYADGRLISVTGTAVDPVRYEYGTDSNGRQYTIEYRQTTTDNATYSDTGEWTKTWTDMLGRQVQTESSDGTSTASSYGASGIVSSTDREGLTTTYTYDDLGRVETTTRAGVTTSYTYDALGRVLTESRGVGSSSTVVRVLTYNASGEVESSQDALGYVTTYSRTYDNGTVTRTTTYPDMDSDATTNGGTRIEVTDAAGRLVSVTGTAVHPVYYQYGYEDDGSTTVREYVQEIRGQSASSGEWTKTYKDLLGRTVKILYPGSTDSDKPCSTFEYDTMGRLIESVDPDGLATLYQYNAKGELEYTAIDMDQNGSIDFAGMDRITRTTNTVTTAHGATVRQTTTQVYSTEGSSATATLSVQETQVVAGTDGVLRSWSTVNGLTTTAATTLSTSGTPMRTATVTKPDGTTSVSTYENGRLTQVVNADSAGAQTSKTVYAYSLFNDEYRVSTITQTDGNADSTQVRTTTYNTYDVMGRPKNVTVSATGVASQTTSYTYDAMGRQTQIDGPDAIGADGTTVDNGVVTNTYATTGELLSTSGARTYPVSYTYDDAGRMKTMTTTGSAGAEVTTWNYNNRGLLTSKVYPDSNGPSYTYTGAGRLAGRTWASGKKTSYTYNNAGDLLAVSYTLSGDADDTSTTDLAYTYDRRGRKSTITDAVGTREITYDAAGQVDTEVIPAGNIFSSAVTIDNDYDYDDTTTYPNPSGLRTSLSVTGPAPSADITGDGAVNVSDLSILSANYGRNLQQLGIPSDQWRSYGDINGNGSVDIGDLSALSAQYGMTSDLGISNYAYDAASRLASITDGEGSSSDNRVTYSYLNNSSLISQVLFRTGSSTKLTTARAFDNLNRLLTLTSTPASGSALSYGYTYNAANQRTTQTLADGSVWTYGYDALGQLASASRKLSDGTTLVPGQQFGYGYDSIGNRLTSSVTGETTRTTTYASNVLNQYSQRTVSNAVDFAGYTDSSSDTVTVNGVSASTRWGTFYHKEVAFTNSDGSAANSSAAYYKAVPVTVTPNVSPVIIDNTDPDNMISDGWTASTSGTGYQGTDFLHDNNDNKGELFIDYYVPVTGTYTIYMSWPTWSNQSSNTSAAEIYLSNNTYLVVNQTRDLSSNSYWCSLGNHSLANGSFIEITNNSDISTGYVLADAIKLVRETVTKVPTYLPQTPEAYTYDADGNLTSDGKWTYTYDGENRLIQMQSVTAVPTGKRTKILFGYDYMGRRVKKATYAWVTSTSGGDYSTTPTSSLTFVYDGWNLMAELDDDLLIRSYSWGPDLSGSLQGAGGIGGLVFVRDTDTSGSYYPAYDGNGNLTAMVLASSGAAAAKYEYSPYGELLTSTGTYAGTNPFRFSTKYTDSETGLSYFGYRYYNPETGRWLNRDPIEEKGGLNLYGYVQNGPISKNDRLGDSIFTHILKVLWNGYWGDGNPQFWEDEDGLIQSQPETQVAMEKLKADVRSHFCETKKEGGFSISRSVYLKSDTILREYLYGTSTLNLNASCWKEECCYKCEYKWDMQDRFDLHPDKYWSDGIISLLLNYNEAEDMPSMLEWLLGAMDDDGGWFSLPSFTAYDSHITWSTKDNEKWCCDK